MLKKTLIIVLLFSGIHFSQEKVFQPHDVFKINAVDEAVISPDEKYAAFTLRVPRPISDGSGSAYE
jgi:hypothetical protein